MMSNIALAGSPPKSSRGDRTLSTVAEQRTEPSTPARSPSPKSTALAPAHGDLADHDHQCRECRASFCQPLGCGHVYCNECLPSPRMSGCPECKRQSIASETTVQPSKPQPEPKPHPEPKPSPDIERQTPSNGPRDRHVHHILNYLAVLMTLWFILVVVESVVGFVDID